VGEAIYESWKDQVKIIHVLDDIGWPTSCENWGNYTGGSLDGVQYPNIDGIPPIIDDGNANWGDAMILSWFNKPPDAEDYPMFYIIDQNMVVNTIQNESLSINSANYIFNDLLSNLSVTFNKKEQIPKNFNLINVYPNPFNPVLHINFELSLAGMTHVNILDIAGAHIKTLHSGFLKSGSHELSWHAESMPSGLYFISLKLGDKNLTKKVVLLK
jgi:hypothetical protein